MKSTTYITSVLVCLIGATHCLNGQEFFKTYSDIISAPNYWTKIQGIYKEPTVGYELSCFTVTDVVVDSRLKWLAVNDNGEVLNTVDLSPPPNGAYEFWNVQLLENYEYLRSSLKWTVDSLIFTKFNASNEVVWEKSFQNVDDNCFVTRDIFNDIWLLFKANSLNGDSLVLNKLTEDGLLLWQSKFAGDFDVNAYSPLQFKTNFINTPTGGIVFQNRKYSEQYWSIVSINNSGQLNWVYDTLPDIELSPLSVGADEFSLVLVKDTSGQESLIKLSPSGEKNWEIFLDDSTGWNNPSVIGAIARKGVDFVVVATCSDTLKAVQIRPDGTFGQQWDYIDSGEDYSYHTGMEDTEGNVLFAGIRKNNGFLSKISPLESFPSASRAIVVEQTSFHLFPNPAREKVTISLPPALDKGNYKMVLMNALGKKVLSQNIQEGETEISVGGVPPGIYYLSVYKNGAVVGAKRLVII